MDKRGENYIISALTVYEIWQGIAASKRQIKKKDKVLKALSNLPVVSFSQSSPEIAGDIKGSLAKDGNILGDIDAMISATALRDN